MASNRVFQRLTALRASGLLLLIAVVWPLLALAQSETPSVTPQPAPVAETTGLTATPAAETPIPSPTPALTNDMRNILRKVGSLPCPPETRGRIFAILYESNMALHDKCISDSGYQFFPYTGKLPTTEQVVGIVSSTECMQLFTGVILADFPECDVDFVSVRTSAEVFLRIKKDADAQRTPPTQEQFYEFYNLNRVVNLMNENAALIEDAFRDSPTAAAVSLSEMTRLMNPIVLMPGVSLHADMSITVADSSASAPAETTGPDTAASSGVEEEIVDLVTSASGNLASETPEPSPISPRLNETLSRSSALSRIRAPICIGQTLVVAVSVVVTTVAVM